MARVRAAVAGLPRAALFQLLSEGFTSPFEMLVACLISVRTRDETSLAMARQMFAVARTPAEMAALEVDRIDALISRAGFHLTKAEQIRTMAQLILAEHQGALPCSFEVMTSYPGIGPKCANLALALACAQTRIGVDTHVHRVTNRWGYVAAETPEKTMLALERVLPERYWVAINELLVPFGKHFCTPLAPRCAACPLLDMCQQRGVLSAA